MDLETAAAELYALPPGEFTARRTKLAGEAKAAGQGDDAKAIGALRKPTVSAWLVNQLVRGTEGAEADVDALEQLGTDLRAAQAQLDGARMKQLSRERQGLVASLVKRAGRLQSLSAAVQREVEETLGAAVADEQAAGAVLSGRLTRALVYSGFGEVDVSDSTATPVPGRVRVAGPASTAKAAPPKKSPAKKTESADDAAARAARERESRIQAATEDLEAARADQAEVEQDVATSREDLADARAREQELSERLDELQREIVEVRRELDSATRSVATADRLHQRADRHATDAQKSVTRAEEALDRLSKS